ncbi:MAG: hypothetical protein U5N26_03815 [Candidatus Marinimicrobia bacterium]|nr:hypothetical protein [Candidatus Neomarinimicrobiota bacterium]
MIDRKELRRQLMHTSTVFIPLLYYFFPDIGPLSGQQWVMILFLVFGGAFVLGDYFRRKNATVKKVFMLIVSPFLRDIENDKMTSASTIAISFFLVLLIFPVRIAVPACMLLSIADSASGIAGRWVGKHPWFKHYTVEGTLAFIAAGFLLFVIGFPYIAVWKALLVVVLCAFFEALLDVFDDNVVIPAAGALMLMMLEV